MKMNFNIFTLPLITTALTSLLIFSGCTNSSSPFARSGAYPTSLSNSPTPSGSSSPTPSLTYQISSVVISGTTANTTQTGASNLSANLHFLVASGISISDVCNTAAAGSPSSLPCNCNFSWQELNSTTVTDYRIQRTASTPVTQVQPNAVVCDVPSVYAAEIADGTTIRVNVGPTGLNTAQFVVPNQSFLKASDLQNSNTGSFTDLQGNAFDNILRYSCYEQFSRGMSIKNFIDTSVTDTIDAGASNAHIPFVMASKFCVAGLGSLPEAEGCRSQNLQKENSAQAYYYNLFIQDSKVGDINPSNGHYQCPQVSPGLRPAQSAHAWPLDTSFSLSIKRSSTFNVGVEAFSTLGGARDSTSVITGCDDVANTSGGTLPQADSLSLTKKCIGFATKPTPDGSCPYFRDSKGGLRATYRLRRFLALYPPVFDSNGKMAGPAQGQPQAVDTLYVVDRPVTAPKGANDPLKPFTMLGPKPCPFSFFDHKAVLDPAGVARSYATTNDPRWSGVNVDGIEFPNEDIANLSCSAVLPLYHYGASGTIFSLGTVNKRNPAAQMKHVYVRPVQAWAPHYEEDTDFEACAPLSGPIVVDPPLHFAKNATTGDVAWCAEAYPTQNTNVAELDTRPDVSVAYSGRVMPFTSHVVKNSTSQGCTATAFQPNVSYAANGAAFHPSNLLLSKDSTAPKNGTCDPGSILIQGRCVFRANHTCDRTVAGTIVAKGTDTSPPWKLFPLLGQAGDIEAALTSDPGNSYGCTLSYDNGGGKAGVHSPVEGCCGNNVKVWSGKVLSTTPANSPLRNLEAHFEPTTTNPCMVPNY